MEYDRAVQIAKYIFAELRGDIKTAKAPFKHYIINQLVALDDDPDEFMKRLVAYKKNNPTAARRLSNVLDVKKATRQQTDNLIHPDRFYYHPALHITSPRPKMKQLDNGEFVEVAPYKFTLQLVKRYTLEDACKRFHIKMGTEETSKNRDLVCMEKLYKACHENLDLLLYTIDTAALTIIEQDKPPAKSPIYLMDYITDGLIILNDRVSACIAGGITHEFN